MMVYICTKFHENILNGITELWSGHEKLTDGQRARYNTTCLRWAYNNTKLGHKRVELKVSCVPYSAQSCYEPVQRVVCVLWGSGRRHVSPSLHNYVMSKYSG